MPSPPLRRLWTAFRRDAASRDSRPLHRIEKWKWPFWGEPAHSVPIHVLAGEADWREAAWMLASFFCATDLAWPIVLHEDGTLPDTARAVLRESFGSVLRIVDRAEADAELAPRLKEFPFCEELRATHTRALTLFDTVHFAAGKRFLLFDPAVLFFHEPREIRAWADAESVECWFGGDAVENSVITATEARDELGVKLWPRADTGLCLLWKAAIDFDFCDRALAQTSIARGAPKRIAGTLLTLCASQYGAGGLLPASYETTLEGSTAAKAISRHYSGAARDRFYLEGLGRLQEKVLRVGED